MTKKEARRSLILWKAWATRIKKRWTPDSPLADLAHRRVLEAELRYREIAAAEKYFRENA